MLDGEGKEKQRACLVGLLSSLASCKSCYSDQGARGRGEKNSGFSQLLVYLEKREKQLQLKTLFSSPQNQNLFKILRHIESCGTCVEN